MRDTASRFRNAIRRWLPRDAFGRQTAILAGGTAIVQTVGIVAAPLLTRLYLPSDFGVMAAFSAVAQVLVLLATLRFEVAIPIAENETKATELLALAAGCGVVATIGVMISAMALPPSTYRLLSQDPRLFAFRFYLIVAVAGGASYACLVGWATRHKHFGLLTRSKISQSVGSVSVQLGVGAAGGGLLGLVLGAVMNLAAGNWLLMKQAIRDLRQAKTSLTIERVIRTASAFRAYPSFTLWTSLLNLASTSVPTILMSAVHGASVTGFYGLGMRVVGIPSSLISVAVSHVFLSRVGEATRSGRLGVEIEEVTIRLSRLAAFIFAVLGIFGPELFAFVFGTRWMEAGSYVRWLSPWLFLAFVFSPQTSVVLARGRQAIDALLQVPILAVRVAALYVGSRWGGAEGAIAAFGLASALTAAAYFSWVLRLGGASLTRVGVVLAVDLGLSVGLVGLSRMLFEVTSRSTIVMMGSLALVTALLQRRIWQPWKSNAPVVD